MTRTLDGMVDDAAFLSADHQAHLADLHGKDDWNANLGEGKFWFTSASGVTQCAVQFVGSAAPGPASWLWGWENVNGYTDDVLVAARAAQRSGIPELMTAELPLPAALAAKSSSSSSGRSPVLDDELPYRLVLATKALSGGYVHYSPVVSGGAQLWMLLDIPGFVLPPLTAARMMRIIGETFDQVRLTDHRRAVLAYLQSRGLVADSRPDGITVELSDAAISVAFDELGRIAEISTQ